MADAREDKLEAGWPPFVAQWVLPYVRESSLWPVLIALLGHVWVALGGLMVAGFRDSHPTAVYWLIGVAIASLAPIGMELRALRRPGALTGVVLGSWVLAAAIGYIASSTGVY